MAAELAVPVLPSRDLSATLAFYEALGFEEWGPSHLERDYLIVRRGDLVLHFHADPDVDPLSTASGCYLYVEDADRLHAAWAPVVVPDPATGSRVVAPVDTDHGLREFALVDPSGNLLRIGSPA